LAGFLRPQDLPFFGPLTLETMMSVLTHMSHGNCQSLSKRASFTDLRARFHDAGLSWAFLLPERPFSLYLCNFSLQNEGVVQILKWYKRFSQLRLTYVRRATLKQVS